MTRTAGGIAWTPRTILLAIAVICFILSALGISLGVINLTDVGLAFGFAAFLVEGIL